MNGPTTAAPSGLSVPHSRERARERMELTVAAITGLCAAEKVRGHYSVDPVLIARRAVRIADAALFELQRPQGGTHEQTA